MRLDSYREVGVKKEGLSLHRTLIRILEKKEWCSLTVLTGKTHRTSLMSHITQLTNLSYSTRNLMNFEVVIQCVLPRELLFSQVFTVGIFFVTG